MNTTFLKTGVSNLEKLKETGTYYARVKVKGRSGGGRGREGPEWAGANPTWLHAADFESVPKPSEATREPCPT